SFSSPSLVHRAPPAPHAFPTRRSSDLFERSFDPDNQFFDFKRFSDIVIRAQFKTFDHIFCLRHGSKEDNRREHVGLSDFLRRRRSEEHTSELQSRENLVCRLLLEKKKN